MHVFRHHHVSDYPEFVSRTHLVKYFYESIARFSCSQKGPAPVTTKRHEMDMAPAVNSSQRISHHVKTRTLKLEGCGTQNLYPLRIVPDDILPRCSINKTFTTGLLFATRRDHRCLGSIGSSLAFPNRGAYA